MFETAPIFADNMVFQSGKPVRIFGTGTGVITVSFMNESKTVTAAGKWITEFSARAYGGPYDISVVSNDQRLCISNVYVGEVLLCAGQSNMQMRMEDEITPVNEYADDCMLRQFSVNRPNTDGGFEEKDGWVMCNRETVNKWGAIAYLCGRSIRLNKCCAVGMIMCCQGASVIQSWLNTGVLEKDVFRIAPEKLMPDHTNVLYAHFNKPAFLHDTMLSTILPFGVSACIWYQGESNTSDAESSVYDIFLNELLTSWRDEFSDSSLPFVIVQIADFEPRMHSPAWMRIQLKQLEAQYSFTNVRTVISRDVCERNMIHPVSKGKLSDRIFEAWNELVQS